MQKVLHSTYISPAIHLLNSTRSQKLLVIAAVMEDMILKIVGSGMLVATNVEKLDILLQCVVLEWSVQRCDWRWKAQAPIWP